VSPLWRDEIGIHVAPRRICLARLKRGLKPAVIAEHEQEVDPGSDGKWEPALAAVEAMLLTPEWQRARVRVVLADCWFRYAIVPWVDELKSTEERLAHARQILIGAFGEAVNEWSVRVSESPPFCARVACTAPLELLDAVRNLCAKHAAPLISMQPQLIAAYENWRTRLPESGAWFVTVGDGTLAAARVANQAWDRVHTVRIGSDWTRELKRLRTFGRLASANPAEGQVYVDAPNTWREVAGPAGEELHWLEDEAESLTTLRRLGRVRRFAA
jgi:hypothetical protein